MDLPLYALLGAGVTQPSRSNFPTVDECHACAYQVCTLSLDHLAAEGAAKGPVPFRQTIEKAYVAVLLPFNGWISENSFRMALKSISQEWPWSKLSQEEHAFWEVSAP